MPGKPAMYEAAEHVICHLQRFVFNGVKGLDVCNVVSLQPEHGFLFRHLQVAIQHVLPFGFASARLDGGEKTGDFIRVLIPFFTGNVRLFRFPIFCRVDKVCGNQQMLG